MWPVLPVQASTPTHDNSPSSEEETADGRKKTPIASATTDARSKISLGTLGVKIFDINKILLSSFGCFMVERLVLPRSRPFHDVR